MIPELTPPSLVSITLRNWVKKNLFNTWYNTLLTFISLGVIFLITKPLLTWSITQANWKVILANLPLFFVGRYPREEYTRLWLSGDLIMFLTGLTWSLFDQKKHPFNLRFNTLLLILFLLILLLPLDLSSRFWLGSGILLLLGGYYCGKIPQIFPQISEKLAPLQSNLPDLKTRNFLIMGWVLSFPIILWLIQGGWGLKTVSTNDWGGLMLTLLTAIISILLSFPLGILLALGRQSTLPILRGFCIAYIEIIRGLPLIGILFLGQVMLQFFLPPDTPKLDRLIRAIASLTLFSAAYLAENVRGGLQSIPKGQIEAAKSLGFKTPFLVLFIVLPQALRAVIPAIVGQFIGLFKDTSLLALFGLLELVGISRTILANPNWMSKYAEVYLFIAIIYWIFCYSMSQFSRQLEKNLRKT